MKIFLIGMAFGLLATAAEAAPRVVATVKPLHSLAAGVMDGSGAQPLLLVSGRASPHTFQLRPSQAEALRSADVLLSIGAGLEPFMSRVARTLPQDTRQVVMAEQQGMRLLPLRSGGEFEPHEHAPGEADHAGTSDPHLWLDPANAMVMVDAIASALAEVDAAQAALYRGNAEALKARIARQEAEIRTRIEVLPKRGFIVFHDAYRYFEDTFGLQAAGAVMLSPEAGAGAWHVSRLSKLAAGGNVACVFSEPQFDAKAARRLAEEAKLPLLELDPEGAALPDGTELYFLLLTRMADRFEECFLAKN